MSVRYNTPLPDGVKMTCPECGGDKFYTQKFKYITVHHCENNKCAYVRSEPSK